MKPTTVQGSGIEQNRTEIGVYFWGFIWKSSSFNAIILDWFNPIALRSAKTLWSFGRSVCNRVKNYSSGENFGLTAKLYGTLYL